MDESVELFLKEQKRLDNAEGPARYLLRQLLSNLVTLAVIAVTMSGLLSFLGSFPRNADNSVRLAIYGPALAGLAVLSALILKIGKPRIQAIRWTCWLYICCAMIAIPTGIVDLIIRNGR